MMNRARVAALLAISGLAMPLAAGATDLEACLKERADTDLTPQFVYEQLPAIDLTASLRRSLAYAEQQMASQQASRARAQQEARMASETESSARTTTYTVSSQEQKALSEAIAAQPKAKALPADAVGQAAKIGTNAAAFEADRLLKAGSTPAEAKRAGEAKGLAAAGAALKLVGASPSPADLARVKGEIAGIVQSAADAGGVAAWARSTTTSVQRSRSEEQSQRTDVSRSRSTTDSTTYTESAQQQWSDSDTLTNDVAFSVPVKIDLNRDLFAIWYAAFIGVGQTTKVEWRASAYNCASKARVMARGAYEALLYVAPRDPKVAADVQRVYELGRAGLTIQYLNGVAGLAADPRLMSKAAALYMLHRLGQVPTPNPTRVAASPDTFPSYVMEAIERQAKVIEAFDQRQRAAVGQPLLPVSLPVEMPPLQAGGGYPVALSPQERAAYAYFDMAQAEANRMRQHIGW